MLNKPAKKSELKFPPNEAFILLFKMVDASFP